MPRKKVSGASAGPSLFPATEPVASAQSASLPDRFEVSADGRFETFRIRDLESGNDVSVPASSYAEVRRALTALFGGPQSARPAAKEATAPAPAAKPRKLFGAAAKSAASKQASEAASAPLAPVEQAPRKLHGAAAKSAEARAMKDADPKAVAPAPKPQAEAKKLHGAAAASAARRAAGTVPSRAEPKSADAKKPGSERASGKSSLKTQPTGTAAAQKKASPPTARAGSASARPEGWEATVRGEGFTMTYEADPENGRPGYRVEANGRVVARVRLEATKSKTDRIVVYSPEGRFEKTPHSKLPGAISRVEVVMDDERVLA